jgi:hypothetical protein
MLNSTRIPRSSRGNREAPKGYSAGYLRGTRRGTRGVLAGYSRGTDGVLTGYSAAYWPGYWRV